MAVATTRRPVNVQTVVIGILLLAVLGFGVYWFGFRGGEVPPPAELTGPTDSGPVAPSQAEANTMRDVLEQATGIAGLELAPDLAIKIVAGTVEGSTLKVALPVTNAPPGQVFAGDINFKFGELEVKTVGGQTTVLIGLDDAAGLSVTGTAKLIGTTGGGIDLNIEDSKLVFQPPSPDVSALSGGSATVTEIGARLELFLQNLPDGASFKVTFAKDPADFISDASVKFQMLADSVNRETGNLADNVAFMINVDKVGITNQDLGDNEITLEVSAQWFDDQRNRDRSILFAKFDDAGNPVLPALDVTASCVTTGSGTVACTGTFTGAQGGLSGFAEFSGGTGSGY